MPYTVTQSKHKNNPAPTTPPPRLHLQAATRARLWHPCK